MQIRYLPLVLLLFSLLLGTARAAGPVAGAQAICTPSAPPASAIGIDAAWLARAGSPPWILDSPGATYVLMTDVFAGGTAFVAGAAGVTLDLNCHRIVYGNARPPEVRNGGFEEDGDGIPGWTVEGHGKVSRTPAVPGLWGRSALTVSELGATDTAILESEPIALFEAPAEYVGVITPKGPSAAKVKLSVVDAVTRAVQASGDSPAVGRGFAATVTFTARTTSPVRLRIEVTGPGPVLLDFAALFRSRDFGIVATPSSWSLPEPLRSSAKVAAACRGVRDLVVKRGTIQQGWGRATGGSAILASWSAGLVLDGVRLVTTGDDTHVVDATGAGGFTASAVTFEAHAQRITNRMKLFAGLNLARAHGALLVEKSRFDGLPQCGLVVARQRPGDMPTGETQSLSVRDNVFRLAALGSDAYALLLVGVSHFTVTGNTATPTSGRGMLLDGFGDLPIEDGEIAHNALTAYERPNLEYGARGLEATALRIRNWSNAAGAPVDKGAVRRLDVHDNVFEARTDAQGVQGAIGARLSFRNNDGRMDHAGNRFARNVFRATTDEKAYFAYALSFSGVYRNVGNEIVDNVIETNGTGLRFGDSDSYRDTEEDIAITGGAVRKLPGPPEVPFAAFERQSVNQVKDIRLDGVRGPDGALLPARPW